MIAHRGSEIDDMVGVRDHQELIGQKLHSSRMYDGFHLAISETLDEAEANAEYSQELGAYTATLRKLLHRHLECTRKLVNITATDKKSSIVSMVSNSQEYVEFTGDVVMAWLWLKQAMVSYHALRNIGASEMDGGDMIFYQDKIRVLEYCFQYEVPIAFARANILDLNPQLYNSFSATNSDGYSNFKAS